jgi:hypothetical protein
MADACLASPLRPEQRSPYPFDVRPGVAHRRIVTVHELADYLGIPQEDLFAFISRNEDSPIPTFSQGEEMYADLEEVENWLLAKLDDPMIPTPPRLKRKGRRK